MNHTDLTFFLTILRKLGLTKHLCCQYTQVRQYKLDKKIKKKLMEEKNMSDFSLNHFMTSASTPHFLLPYGQETTF